MKAILTLMVAMMASAPAVAETIATGGSLDGIVRIFISCKQCQDMEAMRTQIFAPAHRDAKLRKGATATMEKVYNHANRLTEVAEKNQTALRGAHYAQEIESFFELAADAIRFDQGPDIAESIAYLNSELGSRKYFEKVLNSERLNTPEAACRKEFLKKIVEEKECSLANELEAEEAQEAKRRPVLKTCGQTNDSVDACEARKAAKRMVK